MINIYFPFMSEDGVLGIGVTLEPCVNLVIYFCAIKSPYLRRIHF